MPNDLNVALAFRIANKVPQISSGNNSISSEAVGFAMAIFAFAAIVAYRKIKIINKATNVVATGMFKMGNSILNTFKNSSATSDSELRARRFRV
jgi:hypothetical protein